VEASSIKQAPTAFREVQYKGFFNEHNVVEFAKGTLVYIVGQDVYEENVEYVRFFNKLINLP